MDLRLGQHRQGGGLPGAVGPKQPEALPRPDAKTSGHVDAATRRNAWNEPNLGSPMPWSPKAKGTMGNGGLFKGSCPQQEKLNSELDPQGKNLSQSSP